MLRSYLAQRISLAHSLILILPVFIVYQGGILYQLATTSQQTFIVNGADYLTLLLLRFGGRSLWFYALFVALMSGLFWLARRTLNSPERFHPRAFGQVLAESLLYTLAFTASLYAVQKISLVLPASLNLYAAAQPRNTWDMVFQSFGAGFNEEIVFRLLMLGGTLYLGKAMRLPTAWLVAGALLASSAAFSAFHYVGPYADPLAIDTFMYRFLAGLLLGALYYRRGLAIAVYTHTFYDLAFFSLLS